MKRNQKLIAAVVMLVCGGALLAWGLRDPDAAYREQPKIEKIVTSQDVPPAVQATIRRLTATGGKLIEIQEETEGSEVSYEVEIVTGDVKTEYEVSPEGKVLRQKSKQYKP